MPAAGSQHLWRKDECLSAKLENEASKQRLQPPASEPVTNPARAQPIPHMTNKKWTVEEVREILKNPKITVVPVDKRGGHYYQGFKGKTKKMMGEFKSVTAKLDIIGGGKTHGLMWWAKRQALSEMLRADGLLVMQSSGCNEQIPAKIYEYLRAGRPIVALTDPVGDTGTTLQAAGVIDIAPLDSAARIAELLIDFANRARRGDRRLPNPDAVRRASRLGRTQELVELLETVGR